MIVPNTAASANVVIDNVNVDDQVTGILIDGRSTTGSNTVTIRNSTVAGSTSIGVYAIDNDATKTNVMIEGSTVSNNGTQAVVAAAATVRMRDSTVTGNARGLLINPGGQIISHGGNVVAGNTSNGAFSSTVAPQ